MKKEVQIWGKKHWMVMGCVLLAIGVVAPEAAQTSILCVAETVTVWESNTTCDVKYDNLQTALSESGAGDEIWVARGTYKPGTNRSDTFQLKSGVALYGGFTGNETVQIKRNWSANVTTLSGDIGAEGDNSDNSFHVVTGSGTDDSAVLDGFVVTAGNANGTNMPYGGGMLNNGGSPTLTNVTFSANFAPGGGAMYNYYSSPTLSKVTFTGNYALNGGAMYNHYYSSPTLSNVTFSANSAPYGGAMYNYYSSPTLSKVTFSANSASDGGGAMFNDRSNTRLSNVTFRGNSASYGGAMYNHYSSPTLSNVTFSTNSASSNGGAMFSHYYSSPTLSNVTFSANSASSYGGAMFSHNYSSPTLSNVIFSANSANLGGAMCNSGSNPTLSNVTFTANSASSGGGAMDNYSSSPTLSNCILWGDSAPNGHEIYNRAGSSPIVTYSLVHEGDTENGNINTDPLFVRAPSAGADGTWRTADDDYGDLRLQDGSPAIDKGNNDLVAQDFTDLDHDGDATEPVPFDLDGGPRIVDSIVDMGAYEHQAPTLVELTSFRAVRCPRGILAKWKTASEIDNVGFHLWRSKKKEREYVRITESLIPTEGGPTEGAFYSFEDTGVKPGKAYYYKLEDIDTAGVSSFHGPVKARNDR